MIIYIERQSYFFKAVFVYIIVYIILDFRRDVIPYNLNIPLPLIPTAITMIRFLYFL